MNMLWPNGAKIAFNLGFDLDGDTIWRNKIKTLPNGPSYIKGPSIGQYGPKKGALRVMEILDEFGLKATWLFPPLWCGIMQMLWRKF
jgi:peptidoglycan/xylan/chitin deacetylase (PgdA/CDA1 family)